MFNYSDLRFSKGTAYKIHSFTGSIFLVVKKQKKQQQNMLSIHFHESMILIFMEFTLQDMNFDTLGKLLPFYEVNPQMALPTHILNFVKIKSCA